MSKASVNIYIDGQFPNNNQQLIKPVNARNVTKKLNDEGYNLADNDSDDVIEGVSHLFFTDERTGASVAMILQPSSGGILTWVYDPVDNTITPVVTISGGGGIEITDGAKRTALKLNENWVNPLSPTDAYYPIMTLNLPTGQAEHDYYIGYDSSTNSFYRYLYEKVDGALKWTRWLSAFNVPTS